MFSLFRATGPFAQSNVRWYAWFTTAFNARFYYPILAILFLDLGLSLSQFVTLNAIWAATILLAEVPSGALADLIGRRKLLIAAAGLMVLPLPMHARKAADTAPTSFLLSLMLTLVQSLC